MSQTLKKPKILAVVGPTASGKTSLGIALAKEFDGEIISADSRQIYRGMDIGTAKSLGEYTDQGIRNHLVDIRDPNEDYTVAEFKRDAELAIDDILSRKKLPILVGGTGLYIHAVLENLDIPMIAADPKLRAELESEIERDGLAAVFEKLVALDPEAAYIVDPKNPRRVVRALEVALITGKPFTAQRRKNETRYEALELGINPPPEILRERIDRRIDEMMRDGLVDEVKILLKTAGKNRPIAFDAMGYREIIDHLEGQTTLEEAVTSMKLNTWHFARRQQTWFRKDKNVQWIKTADEAIEIAKKFLT